MVKTRGMYKKMMPTESSPVTTETDLERVDIQEGSMARRQ